MSAPRVGPRTLAGLVVVLTFVVGALAGAVTDRSMTRARAAETRRPPERRGPPGSPQERAGREQHRERFVQQLTRELSLTPSQVAKIDTITRNREQRMNALWREVQPRVRTLLQETRAEIDQVLTPEQRAKLQQMRKQHEAARARQGGGPPHDSTVAPR